MCHNAHYPHPSYVHVDMKHRFAYLRTYTPTCSHRTCPHATLMAKRCVKTDAQRRRTHVPAHKILRDTPDYETCYTHTKKLMVSYGNNRKHTNYDIRSHRERYQGSCSVFYSYDAT